jgi:hypothetical protein
MKMVMISMEELERLRSIDSKQQQQQDQHNQPFKSIDFTDEDPETSNNNSTVQLREGAQSFLREKHPKKAAELSSAVDDETAAAVINNPILAQPQLQEQSTQRQQNKLYKPYHPTLPNTELSLSELVETEEERLYRTTVPFADKNLDILKKQLAEYNATPLEYIPLELLKQEVANIVNQVNSGEFFDERRLDYLLRCMDVNPEYILEKNQQLEEWRSKIEPFAEDALQTMRGYIPPHIFSYSESYLKEELSSHWSMALIKRIYQKKCLWLIRLSRVDIERLHEADLMNKFNFQGQNLDIIEVAALYAAIPKKLWNDPTGKKMMWRNMLEKSLQDMMEEEKKETLTKAKKRHPAYQNQLPLYGDRDTLHELTNIVSGKDAMLPATSRKSFEETIANRSIVSAAVVVSAIQEGEWVSTAVPVDSTDSVGSSHHHLVDESSIPGTSVKQLAAELLRSNNSMSRRYQQYSTDTATSNGTSQQNSHQVMKMIIEASQQQKQQQSDSNYNQST